MFTRLSNVRKRGHVVPMFTRQPDVRKRGHVVPMFTRQSDVIKRGHVVPMFTRQSEFRCLNAYVNAPQMLLPVNFFCGNTVDFGYKGLNRTCDIKGRFFRFVRPKCT